MGRLHLLVGRILLEKEVRPPLCYGRPFIRSKHLLFKGRGVSPWLPLLLLCLRDDIPHFCDRDYFLRCTKPKRFMESIS